MKIIKNSHYSLINKAFNTKYINDLSAKILSSNYLGKSQLSDSFVTTKGFSVIFTRAKINQVKEHFPLFQTYLTTALNPQCNAFYLNSLILETKSCIKPHIDCSFSAYCQSLTIANLVSVLYVDVPSNLEGGELILTQGKTKVATIKPETNTLLSFRGDLLHSVNEVRNSTTRISLVCEQYLLTENKLREIPEFKVESERI